MDLIEPSRQLLEEDADIRFVRFASTKVGQFYLEIDCVEPFMAQLTPYVALTTASKSHTVTYRRVQF
jgi:hypothetical protein